MEAELKVLQSKLNQWRRNGRVGGRVPEELWELGVRLAHKFGTTSVVKATGLHSSSLRRRLGGLGGDTELLTQSVEPVAATFVELLPSEPPRVVSRCVLQIPTSTGRMLALDLGGIDVESLTVLVKELAA